MAVLYLDTSALAKRYLSETGSTWVVSLFAPSAGHTVFIAAITAVEFVAAITRRARGGTIPASESVWTKSCQVIGASLRAIRWILTRRIQASLLAHVSS